LTTGPKSFTIEKKGELRKRGPHQGKEGCWFGFLAVFLSPLHGVFRSPRLGIVVFYHGRRFPERLLFSVLCFSLGTWALTLSTVTTHIEFVSLGRNLVVLVRGIYPNLLFLFALALNAKEPRTSKRWRVAILYLPALFAVFVWKGMKPPTPLSLLDESPNRREDGK